MNTALKRAHYILPQPRPKPADPAPRTTETVAQPEQPKKPVGGRYSVHR